MRDTGWSDDEPPQMGHQRSEGSVMQSEPSEPRRAGKRVKVLFLVEAPSSTVHVARPREDRIRLPSLCGRRPQEEWTRLWEGEMSVPPELLGVCRDCVARLRA